MDISKPKQQSEHVWQFGAYLINLPTTIDNTEAEGWKYLAICLHQGTFEIANKYHIGEYQWMIDGEHVVLPTVVNGEEAPDTEEHARANLGEALSSHAG